MQVTGNHDPTGGIAFDVIAGAQLAKHRGVPNLQRKRTTVATKMLHALIYYAEVSFRMH